MSGSVDPTSVLPKGAEISRESRTVFRYTYSDPSLPSPVRGVWIGGVDNAGFGLGFEQIEVSLPSSQDGAANSILTDFSEGAKARFAEYVNVPEGPTRYALDNFVGDPIYVTLDTYTTESDGSYTISVDPWTPDLGQTAGLNCHTYLFYDPAGGFCLMNVNTRMRKVTVLPTADVWIGDTRSTVPEIWDYVMGGYNTPFGAVFLRLDSSGYVISVQAYHD